MVGLGLGFRWHPRFVIGASSVAPVRGGIFGLIWFGLWRRFGLLGFSLASAWRLRGACVAPVPGKRKPLNTANSCFCLRAPNSSSASHDNLQFAARCQRFESAPHPLRTPASPHARSNLRCSIAANCVSAFAPYMPHSGLKSTIGVVRALTCEALRPTHSLPPVRPKPFAAAGCATGD